MDVWAQLGVGGTLVYLVLKEVFGFLKPILMKRRGDSHGNGHITDAKVLAKLRAQVGDLHRLHSQTDSDGTPLIYVPRTLSAAIDNLADATRESTRVLTKLGHDVDEVRREVHELQAK